MVLGTLSRITPTTSSELASVVGRTVALSVPPSELRTERTVPSSSPAT